MQIQKKRCSKKVDRVGNIDRMAVDVTVEVQIEVGTELDIEIETKVKREVEI